LVDAEKERQAELADLKAELEQLRERIAALEARPVTPAIRAVG